MPSLPGFARGRDAPFCRPWLQATAAGPAKKPAKRATAFRQAATSSIARNPCNPGHPHPGKPRRGGRVITHLLRVKNAVLQVVHTIALHCLSTLYNLI